VIKDDQTIHLTSKEFEILKIFVVNNDRVYTKNEIYRLVWNEEGSNIDNIINVHINRLRTKIGDNLKHPFLIKTMYGFGYKLGVDVFKIE
jgi:DNA-binding response OmpR family regulator